MGEMEIKFNSTMNTHFNHTWINDTVIDMYMEAPIQRRFEDDFDPTVLNFTWEVVSFEDDLLQIQLEFEFPFEISPIDI